MRLLIDICLSFVADNIANSSNIFQVRSLPPLIKSLLLERILRHDSFDADRLIEILDVDFFSNLDYLQLSNCSHLNDRFLFAIAASGCSLREFAFMEAMSTYPDGVTEHGIASVLAEQKHLECLKLISRLNFRTGVLNRLSSSCLNTVELIGDAICRCFALNNTLAEKMDFYQRDICHPLYALKLSSTDSQTDKFYFVMLAINNPTITTLCLKDVALDIDDCYSLFVALRKTLRHLEVDVIRYYAFCERTHCYSGRDFVTFLEMANRLCSLSFLQCRCIYDDFQEAHVCLTSSSLVKLNLQGHLFKQSLLLPCNLEVLKISLDGHENENYFGVLQSLPYLRKLYIRLSDNFVMSSPNFQSLFTKLGERIVSITNVGAASFQSITSLVTSYCLNLKTYSLSNNQTSMSTPSGCELFALFADCHRSAKFHHLQLNLERLPAEELRLLCNNCHNLKSLCIRGCQTMDDLSIKLLAECARNVTFLDVSRCSNVSDVGIVAIAAHCQYLEAVYLLGTSAGDPGVVALARQCGRLKICGVEDSQISPVTSDLLRHFGIKQLSSSTSL
ncbi:unnamed protein product [Soboliphyme baturini]|uniref:F-box domain-containing protein n=1 Tax=Soboliphyme baturini TaxID=241478 RepID=A0A183IMF5_9BILA|nr:unnamed protein product [Soboliphyme baturini]